MRGSHVIKHWSKTQAGIALSSGEAELYALIKSSIETIGVQHLIKELGYEHTGNLYTDSTAAKGTVSRTGSARLKHVETNLFWIQEKAASGQLRYGKVARSNNIADMLTHHWDLKVGCLF